MQIILWRRENKRKKKAKGKEMIIKKWVFTNSTGHHLNLHLYQILWRSRLLGVITFREYDDWNAGEV